MYITMMPVILAGILNMLFVKTGIYMRHKTPIDNRKCLSDGKRIFGDNKTWAGFLGMIAAGASAQIIWGFVCLAMPDMNYFYNFHNNSILFNILAGAAEGFAYVLFELPNSFIKRRLDIPCGKTDKGFKGKLFFIIDQIDSLIGVAIVFSIIYPMPLWQYFLYIFLGAVTHILVNLVLYKLKIRKNI